MFEFCRGAMTKYTIAPTIFGTYLIPLLTLGRGTTRLSYSRIGIRAFYSHVGDTFSCLYVRRIPTFRLRAFQGALDIGGARAGPRNLSRCPSICPYAYGNVVRTIGSLYGDLDRTDIAYPVVECIYAHICAAHGRYRELVHLCS